jgi:hypothetical protein
VGVDPDRVHRGPFPASIGWTRTGRAAVRRVRTTLL